MVTKRLSMRALAGLALWAGFSLSAQAQLPEIKKPEDAFRHVPRQPGVNVSTPTPDQAPQCKVEPIPGKDNKPMGYVVRDPMGRPVRQFVSYDGKNFNIIAYYINGIEAYREIYPPTAGEPYQFRWLGPNGSKWGLDRDRDGRVDEWVVLSPEELSQELLAAILTRDVKRAEALVVTKANLDGRNGSELGLPAADAQRLLDRAAGAAQRVGAVADALKLPATTQWVQLGLAAPQTVPSDAFNPPAKDDLVTHKNGTLLVHDGKETKFFQTGELVQIGRAWKLVDGPGAGMGGGDSGPAGPAVPPDIAPLVQKLNDLDGHGFPNPPTQEALAAHNAKRVELLEQIVGKLQPKDQETWLKLLADALSAASEGEKADGKHITRLKLLRETVSKGPNPALAAYVGFRYLVAENSIALATAGPGEYDPVQVKWRTNLEDFIKAYPTSDEAPEAMLRLAMAFEYVKDGEKTAKEWYSRLARDYSRHPHAAKANGAIKRLECEGKPLELVGTTLENGTGFNVSGLKDKVVVVYYFAGWSRSLADDVRKLQALEKEYGPKGMVLLTVCLDNDPATAKATVTRFGVPGGHLHIPGGLDSSPLATSYGILVVPHMFVTGKDGKIVNRNAQAATVEEDLKKLLP